MRNVCREMIDDYSKTIWGESPFTFYFSFKGFFNRSQYFGALVTINAFLKFAISFNSLFLAILAECMAFYATVVATQKRCLDIKMRSTFFILVYSVAYFFCFYYKSLKEYDLSISPNMKYLFGLPALLYILILIFLLFMPGRKDKDINLISPLLKRPFVYFIIYLVLCFISYLLLQPYIVHFNSINS